MSTTHDVLADAFTRVAEDLPGLLNGLSPDDLTFRPGPDANPIGWLVWHLTRVQDDHLAGVAQKVLGDDGSQVWEDGWRERFALSYEPMAHGYGMTSEDVGHFHGEASLLAGYHAAVHQATLEILDRMEEQGIDESLAVVVDENWDPPVTALVRLVSVVNDITQHLGQAAYAKGLLDAS